LSHQNTVFHELIKPVVRQDFEQLAKVHHVGQKFRAASRWDQFIAILMSQFSCRGRLRERAKSYAKALANDILR
jgi:hypothetical protein